MAFSRYRSFLLHVAPYRSLKKAATLLAPGNTAVLVEEVENALLGLVAPARQVLERLAASGLLLAADNAAVLVLNKVRLLETTGSVLRRSVKDLCFGANSGYFGHLILLTAIIFSSGGGADKQKVDRATDLVNPPMYNDR